MSESEEAEIKVDHRARGSGDEGGCQSVREAVIKVDDKV